MVKHSVSDFGAFLKVYDGEGAETRKSHGLIDRAMSIGMEDSTSVQLVFAISDMEKAKARMQSAELKQLMADAKMVGEPKFFFYRFDFLRE